MRIPLLILVVFLSTSLPAQIDTLKRDSLLRLLNLTENEKDKIKIYTELGILYEASDFSKGLSYADTLLELALKYKDQASVAEASVLFGNIYWYLGEHDKVMEHYLKALSLREKLNDQRGLGVIKYNISLLFNSLGNNKESIRYAMEAIEHYKKSGHLNYMCEVYIHISNVYAEENKPEQEARYFRMAGKLIPEIKDNHSKAYFFMNKASKFRKTNFDSALFYYQKSYYLDSLDNQIYMMTATLNNIGSLLASRKKYDEAIKYTLRSVEISKKNNQKLSLSYSYGNLAEYYSKKGNFAKAYEYLTGYNGLKWELYKEESQKLASEMEAKFQDEKKQLIIENQKKENEAKDAKIEKQTVENKRINQQKIFIGTGLGLMIIISFIIYRNLQRKKKDNALIISQKEEIAGQKEELQEKHNEIRDSIDYAKRIQTALLTGEDYWNEISTDHFVLFQPKDVVSGDFFWAFHTENNNGKIAVWCVADCTGHGVPGAFMSMLGISFLNEIVIESGITDPKEILEKLREKVIKSLMQKNNGIKQRDGMDIALCVWNKTTNVLEFAGANNPLWILRKNSGQPDTGYTLLEFKPSKIPVGQFGEDLEPFTKESILLQKDDTIFSFSDGYADQFGGPKGKKLRYANFKNILLASAHLTNTEQKTILAEKFNEWKGKSEQIDDVCVIGIKVN